MFRKSPKFVKFFISGLVILFGITLASSVLADSYGLSRTASRAGLDKYGNDVPSIVGNVVGAGLSLIGVFFFILMVYGGFVWMTAHGNDENIKKAQGTIVAAIIGMIIVLASYAITNFVFQSVRLPASQTPPRENDRGPVPTTPQQSCVQITPVIARCRGITCPGFTQAECNDSEIVVCCEWR